MIFTPRELARSVFECRENVVRGLTAGEVSVCLRVQKGTGDRLPPGEAAGGGGDSFPVCDRTAAVY